jgi:succinate dehydrogenase hydrophobic anchor subunit
MNWTSGYDITSTNAQFPTLKPLIREEETKESNSFYPPLGFFFQLVLSVIQMLLYLKMLSFFWDQRRIKYKRVVHNYKKHFTKMTQLYSTLATIYHEMYQLFLIMIKNLNFMIPFLRNIKAIRF